MTEHEKIKISVNGESVEIAVGATIVELLERLKVNTRAIAVEVNQEIQSSDRFHDCVLQAGDVLEVVTLVGGG